MRKMGCSFMEKRTIGLAMVMPPYAGGVFQYENMIAEAIWNNRDKYNIIMICNNSYWINWCIERDVKFIEDKFDVYEKNVIDAVTRHPYISTIYNTLFSQLGIKIRREKIEILLFGSQLIFLTNKLMKQICPIHDLMHKYESRFPERRQLKEDDWLRCELQFANTVLTDSQLGKEQVIESYLKDKRKRPFIQVLPYTISKHITDYKEEEMKTPDKYIFYPAQFWQHKNHLNLLKAVHLLKETIPDIHLILVGSGKNALNIVEKYIGENELTSNVTIYDFVTKEKLIYLYKHAVAMVMPSYFGPTNIPPLEAMTLGCPVAVSNNYAMGEQVGDAGLLFNPDSIEEIADCINRLWNDEQLRDEMREKGYRQIAAWQPKDFEQRLVKTIDMVLNS